RGWIYCRDHPEEAVEVVLQNNPALGRGHQIWEMNEINALIWPAPQGIGLMDPAAFQRTAGIAREFGGIHEIPPGAYRTDLATAAMCALQKEDLDVYGREWKRAAVEVTPGGN